MGKTFLPPRFVRRDFAVVAPSTRSNAVERAAVALLESFVSIERESREREWEGNSCWRKPKKQDDGGKFDDWCRTVQDNIYRPTDDICHSSN